MKDFINDKLTNDVVKSVYPYSEKSIQQLLNRFYSEIKHVTEISNQALEFLQWLVEKGVKDEVVEELTNMYNDGRLEQLVNINKYNELDNKIDNIENTLVSSIDTLQTNIANDIDNINLITTELNNQIIENKEELKNDVMRIDYTLPTQLIKVEEVGEMDNPDSFYKMQGGTIANNKLYYFILNQSESRAKLIEVDCSNYSNINSYEFGYLGHCNDMTYNPVTNELIITGSEINQLFKINLETKQVINQIINNAGTPFQGVAYYNNRLYLKSTDHKTIFVCNNYEIENSFELEDNPYELELRQGIEIVDDILYDVKGLPASIVAYDLNGKLLTFYTFNKPNDIVEVGELQFVTKYNNDVILGSMGRVDNDTTYLNILSKSSLVEKQLAYNKLRTANLNGIESIYVSQSYNGESDGTQTKPFNSLKQAINSLEDRVGRVRILDGTYENVQVRFKNITIEFQGDSKINGMLIENSDVVLINANIGYLPGDEVPGLRIVNSTVYLNGDSRIESGNFYCIQATDSYVSIRYCQYTTPYDFYIYANRTTVINPTKINAFSSVVNFNRKEGYVDNSKLDDLCLTKFQKVHNIDLTTGNVPISNQMLHNSIRVRGAFDTRQTTIDITQYENTTTNVIQNITIADVRQSESYIALINFTYSDNILTIINNYLIRLSDGKRWVAGVDTDNPFPFMKLNQVTLIY